MSDNQIGQNQSEGKKGGSGKLIIIIGAIIIVLLVVVIVLLLTRKSPEQTDSGAGRDVERTTVDSSRLVLDEESANDVFEEMRQKVEEGMFECKMSMTWTYEDGSSESKDAIVANSENNSYPFYFDVTLNDTDELIYSSPVVPVGSQMTGIKLDKELDPGEYKATVMYSLLEDEESQVIKSQAGFVVTIIVEN